MSQAETSLQTMLAGGPKASREVIVAMASQGITQKQLRRAREKLGVVVTRSGCGKDMRSTWGLPIETPRALASSDGGPIHAQRGLLRKGEIPDDCGSDASQGEVGTTTMLQPFEEGLIASRVALFVSKGLDPSTARHVAVLLTHDRDRPGMRGGSCAECQNWIGPRACSAADVGFGQGPRDASEIWFCGYARLSGR